MYLLYYWPAWTVIWQHRKGGKTMVNVMWEGCYVCQFAVGDAARGRLWFVRRGGLAPRVCSAGTGDLNLCVMSFLGYPGICGRGESE